MKKQALNHLKITNNHLLIRPFVRSDQDDLFCLLGNEQVVRFLGINQLNDMVAVNRYLNECELEYERQEIFRLGIELCEKHKIIGFIGVSRYDLTQTTAQVVYGLSEEYWHQGLMPEALKLFVHYLINDLHKEIIIGTHIDENSASGKVLLKAGFKRDPNYDQMMVIKGVNQHLTGYSYKAQGVKK
ncbi:MAG: GNAT family N-acetyltransferase [Bacilli bacterium]